MPNFQGILEIAINIYDLNVIYLELYDIIFNQDIFRREQ
jgi:hypothetical protein